MSNNKLIDIFTITDFFDKARWSSAKNYNLINFYNDSLSNDEKLLTHWLCYITDRQMPFDRIWSIGGFIFSEMVHQMNKKRDFSILNPTNKDSAYFIKRRHYPDRGSYDFKDTDYDKYLFVSRQKVNGNKRLLDYDFKKDTLAYFIPRYYPSDYKAILYTYTILEAFDNSLIKYIVSFLNNHIEDISLIIPKLLFSLYLLTYYDVGQPKGSDINFSRFSKDAKTRKKNVLKILKDSAKFKEEFKRFENNQIYNQKRAWCSLRDFFKSPEFKNYFFGALKAEEFSYINKIKKTSLLHSFELPGDVWNNNPKFRECIFGKTPYIKDSMSISRLLRTIFTNENISMGYPEQFDITFDFVSRMCVPDNCDICAYGILNGRCSNFNLICTKDKQKYCPVTLTSCGYKFICEGDSCPLVRINNRHS